MDQRFDERRVTRALLLTTAGTISIISFCAVADTYQAEPAGAAEKALSGFNNLWQPGSTWDTGNPSREGEAILYQNLAQNAEIARTRTDSEVRSAYLFDRRNQSYSIIDGLGELTDSFKKETGAYTTITDMPADAGYREYDEKGNGLGTTNNRLGKVVELVSVLRGSNSSTSPDKAYFSYPRPFRQTLDGKSLDYVTIKQLMPVRSNDPSNDGGFPSGHTNAAFLTGVGLAYSVPREYNSLIMQSARLGYSRVVAGMHSPLDVMGGRIHAIFYSIENLITNPELREQAYSQAQCFFGETCGAGCGSTINIESAYSQYQQDKRQYLKETTFNFTPTGDTTRAPVVPKNAEVLIETRYPYLSDEQRRQIFASTETTSGGPLDNGTGYDRLNLLEAGNGYSAFDKNVIINMDAAKGGYSAADVWLNDIDGSGSFTKQGTGQLTLAGRNNWSGGTTIEKGTLIGTNGQALGTGKIVDNGILTYDLISDSRVSNDLAGNGTFNKQGVAQLNYLGDGRGFTGTTNVREGTLAVNGRLGGNISVDDGATLGGIGEAGTIQLKKGSSLAPGNSIGKLSSAGNVTFEDGSHYDVELSRDNSDSLTSAGGVNIGQADVRLHDENNTNLLSQQSLASLDGRSYHIITAHGGVNGNFSSVQSDYLFLGASTRSDADGKGITLIAGRNDRSFASVAHTANERSVAIAADSLPIGNTVREALMLSRSESEARDALNSLDGQLHADIQDTLLDNQSLIRTALDERMRQVADLQELSGIRADDGRVWGRVLGDRRHTDSRNGAAGFNGSTYGVILGSDRELSYGWQGGVAGGYTRTNQNSHSGDGDIDNWDLALYGSKLWGNINLRVGGSLGWHDINTERYVGWNAISGRTRQDASYNASSNQLFANIGYKLGDRDLNLEPYAGLSYANVRRGSFSEHGHGTGGLKGDSNQTEQFLSSVGIHSGTQWRGAQGAIIHTGLALGWQHALNGVDRTSSHGFSNGSSFDIHSPDAPRDAVTMNAGLGIQMRSNVDISLNYRGLISRSRQDNGVEGALSWRF